MQGFKSRLETCGLKARRPAAFRRHCEFKSASGQIAGVWAALNRVPIRPRDRLHVGDWGQIVERPTADAPANARSSFPATSPTPAALFTTASDSATGDSRVRVPVVWWTRGAVLPGIKSWRILDFQQIDRMAAPRRNEVEAPALM
jgi:hypothetical protein